MSQEQKISTVECQTTESTQEMPEVVEIRMTWTKDAVQVGKGGDCSWK